MFRKDRIQGMMISCIKVRKMLSKGYVGYLTNIICKSEYGLSIDEVLIARKYIDMFLGDLLRLAPKREVDFSSDLIFSIALIFKDSYQIALIELHKLKK